MKRKHKIFFSALAIAGVAGSGLFATNTLAQGADTTDLISKIASKFGLNQDEVKQVFNEYHQTKQTERLTDMETNLSQAVTDGDITAEQKDLVIAKIKEQQTKTDEIMKMTDDTARKEAMDKLRDEMRTWATTNNIDMKWLRPEGMGKGMGGGGRGMGGPGRGMHQDNDSQSSDQTTTN